MPERRGAPITPQVTQSVYSIIVNVGLCARINREGRFHRLRDAKMKRKQAETSIFLAAGEPSGWPKSRYNRGGR